MGRLHNAYQKTKEYTLHQKWDTSVTVAAKEQEPKLRIACAGELHLSVWDALAIGVTLCATAAAAWIASAKEGRE